MANDRIFVFDGEQRGALKMLINKELGVLLKAENRNETMIEQFRDILDILDKGRPLP